MGAADAGAQAIAPPLPTAGRARLIQSLCTERYVAALEQMQLPFATQLEDSLEVLLAPSLMALCLLAEFAIGRLSVTRLSRHVCPLFDRPLGSTPIGQITESDHQISRDRLHL
jgi:hypothetical protein